MKPRKLPPLPKSVPHFLGPIPVRVVPDLKAADGEECYGLWDAMQRVIKVRAGMARVVEWTTLIHEQTHMELADLGIKLTEEQEEAVCNALAAARVHQMLYPSR